MTARYVPEFDTLRALAVLSVLLFHGFPELTPAGFLGVDIFFVISGYVISRVYLQTLLNRQTSWKTFFYRRFRRLAPAYGLVLLASVPPAVALLEPHLLRDFGLSLLAQPFYLQNVAFWWQGDYFTSALSKPLLHTWSLAVEEQFYLLFFLLVCVSRWFRTRLAFYVLLAAGAALSLYLSVLVAGISPKTSFYLIPFRAWEFVLGIGAWLLVRHWPARQLPSWHATATWLILAMLLVMVLLVPLDESASTGYTFAVCLLTAALLVSFDLQSHSSYRWLRLKPLLVTGQASYAIYLWHWPVIVYATALHGDALTPATAIGALLLSALLGFVTWRYVEAPIRHSAISWPHLRNAVIASSAVFLLSGAVLLQSRGALFLYEEPVRTWLKVAQDKSPYRCPLVKRLGDLDAELCSINSVNSGEGVLIIGDSVADQVDEMIAALAAEQHIRAYLTTRNCDLNEFGATDFCSVAVLDRLMDAIERLQIQHVLAISNWHRDARPADFELSLDRLTEHGIQVTLVQALPSGDYFNPRVRAMRQLRDAAPVPPITPTDHARMNASRVAVFDSLRERYGARLRLLDPGTAICRTDPCDFDDGRFPLYFDEVHLSSYGAQRVRPVYARELQHLVRMTSAEDDASTR